MGLYTVILEYAGGTYIEQFIAEGLDAAAGEWARRFVKLDDTLNEKTRRQVVSGFERHHDEYGLSEIDGVSGVWCSYFNVEQTQAWVHFLLTALDTSTADRT